MNTGGQPLPGGSGGGGVLPRTRATVTPNAFLLAVTKCRRRINEA